MLYFSLFLRECQLGRSDGRFFALLVLSAVFVFNFATTQYYAVLTTKADRLLPSEVV